MIRSKNRWLIALSAVGIHISIGSIYAYSVWKNPIQETLGWSRTEVGWAFSIAILFLGFSAAFLGHFVEKHGPRKGGLLAACFFGLGMIGAGFAIDMESKWLYYLFYGAITGIGLGVGYISPVSTLVKWFPDRRGLATGLAIMGFGFGALIAGPLINAGIANIGISNTFYGLGAAYFLVMVCSSLYLAPPPKDWQPVAAAGQQVKPNARRGLELSQKMANEAVKTTHFYYLWIMLFINVCCGIAVISVASPMAQEIAGMSAASAATMVGLMGLFNGLGRIGWASFSDYFGRPNTYVAFFVLQIAAFIALPVVSNATLFQILIFLILTCYGGGFAAVPAYISDLFGTRQLAAIHGYLLTAWAAAGVVGPTLASSVREMTDSYVGTLYIFAGLFCVALAVSIWIQVEIRRIVPAVQPA
ncbi:OFA family oxalate/formate antiporter-like MFS transporter [Rhodopirellula rubra]|uniref:OFA family oxalate/formate antiporter-like MFS transporter n=1 Tax=Aporhodopirellula rubra TaxID=980271 RepID=A0A7W5E525_9BACT|nr:OFA family MFS transporter [Aporhodopirellula rubra]MBB3210356.1 OFA family oxalate/formate antiporter-like MFS transporter [Aporhodopirellula rubra]